MSLSVTCQNCGKAYRVKEELAGKKFRCQQCTSVVAIPVVESLPELGVEALLPAPVPFTPATNMLPMPPVTTPDYPVITPSNVPTTNNLPLPLIKARPKTKQLSPARVSGSYILALFVVADLFTAIFVYATMVSFDLGMLVLVALLLPVGIIFGGAAGIGVLRVAFQEDTSCGVKCLFVPFYFHYFLVSRWRYTARHGWMIIAQLVATVIIFFVIVVQAPRATSQERSRRIQSQNERILNRSLERSGLVISSQKQSASQQSGSPNSPVNIYGSSIPPMVPADGIKMHNKIKSVRDDVHRQMTDFDKLNEKRRQEMISNLEADPIRRRQRNEVSEREPTAPERESRGRTRSTTEVEAISTPATSAGRLEANQKVFVLWGSQWYECEVVDAADREKPKIHYFGWSNVSDEHVSLDRVRVPNP